MSKTNETTGPAGTNYRCPICGERVTRYVWEAGVTTYSPCGDTHGIKHADAAMKEIEAAG